jgi:protein tyrosine phosphatase (PTP) superfamily phosphohydrolase (DUF442 family)
MLRSSRVGFFASLVMSTVSLAQQPAPAEAPKANSRTYDRGVWQQLLSDHTKIHRVLRHREENGVGIVEAVTESDDPEVAARIIDHAKAMQARMKTGEQVRMWDPVFKELFANHDKVKLEVTPTDKGVTIVESSEDPRTVALLRSHAMGVNEFVRAGHAVARKETVRFNVGDPLPPDEVAIGGLPHRFLLSQPTAGQVRMLQSQGVQRFINFRKPQEHAEYDEAGAVAEAGAEYCNIPYAGAKELTDEVLASARLEFANAEAGGIVLAAHCRTGNRVGPGLASYLALDRGIDVEQAIAAARAVGMADPMLESATRDYIGRASRDASQP